MSEEPFIWLALHQSAVTEIIVHSNTKEHIRRLKNDIAGRYFMSPAGLIIHVDEHANDGMSTLTIRPDDESYIYCKDQEWNPKKVYAVLEDWIERVFEATRIDRKVKVMAFPRELKRDADIQVKLEEFAEVVEWILPSHNRRKQKRLVDSMPC